MILNPAADFIWFDNLADVSFRSRLAGDRFAAAVTVSALKRAGVSEEVAAGAAAVNRRSTSFHFLTSALSVAPKRGDTLTEADGTEWAVVTADTQTLDTRYKLECVEIP